MPCILAKINGIEISNHGISNTGVKKVNFSQFLALVSQVAREGVQSENDECFFKYLNIRINGLFIDPHKIRKLIVGYFTADLESQGLYQPFQRLRRCENPYRQGYRCTDSFWLTP